MNSSVRNAAQKPAWRAEIVPLIADGIGTNEVMRRTGKSKTCVRYAIYVDFRTAQLARATFSFPSV